MSLRENDMPVRTAVALIRALRNYQMESLRTLEREAYERIGHHQTDGTVSLWDVLKKSDRPSLPPCASN